jgi:hypothetical protein
VRVFEEYPKITAEQLLVRQLNGGQHIIESYWMVISNEARTNMEHVLGIAFKKLREMNHMRFAIDEAQLAASMFVSKSDFHFEHGDTTKGARRLLYEYCRLVTKHMSLTQLIVAGTDLTVHTAAQAILERTLVHRLCFRC